MRLKITSLIITISFICCLFCDTVVFANNAQENELISILKSNTNEDVVKTFFADYDSDGIQDLIAFTGRSVDGDEYYPATFNGNVWFISNNNVQKVEIAQKGIGVVINGEFAPSLINQNGTDILAYNYMWGNGDLRTTIFYIKDNKPLLESCAGYLSVSSYGFSVSNSAYDGNILKTNFNNGLYTGMVRSYKDYWYFWDTNDMKLKEYGAIEISKEQFLSFNGAQDILDLITKGRIYNILYRGNGIININIIEDTGYFAENDGYNTSHLIVQYSDNSVSVVEYTDYDGKRAKFRNGFYLNALEPQNAIFPEFKAPQTKEICIILNGETLEFDQPPIIRDDRTLVPMRAIFEAMGASVEWDGNTKTVTSTKNDLLINLSIGDYVMLKNGVEIYLDVPAQLIGDYTMVPIRAVAEAFGSNVEWDSDAQTIYITSHVKQNAFIVNADADITQNDAALVRSVLLENKLLSVSEDNCHSAFEPSSETFYGIINQIVREAGDNDITYFFYSGHGGSDGHISPTYNNITHNGSFTLTPQELIDTLNTIPGTIVIILDSCYSGAINNLDDLNKEKFKIITSSSASEYSNASDLAFISFISSEQLGRFTEVFLNALGGLEGTNPIYNAITKRDGKVKADYNNDNNVTLQELYQYVSENIDDSQTPSVSDEYDNTVIYSY